MNREMKKAMDFAFILGMLSGWLIGLVALLVTYR